jgi:outer membrane lipoprotein carrier protein
MHLIKTLGALALCFFFTQPHAGQARDMLDHFLDNTQRMQADFQQKLLDNRGLLLQQSAGQFTLKRPGKFRWDYSIPYPQKIISNGKIIWIYDSELEQVSIKPYDQILSGAPVMLLDQGNKLDVDFRIEDNGLVNQLYQVTLKPRAADNEFKEIRIGLRDNVLRSMMLVDAFEQTTVIEFDHLQINPPLDDALFEFEPPQGTDIVGQQ